MEDAYWFTYAYLTAREPIQGEIKRVNKIREIIPDLFINIHDKPYDKKNKNNIERRNQRLINWYF